MSSCALVTQSDKQAWNAFLEKQPSLHHAFSWEWQSILEDTFSHKPKYLIAKENNGEVTGILPLFYVKSFLFGSALISVPYLNAGGILASSQSSFNALLDAARGLSEELSVDYVELRNREADPRFDKGIRCKSHKVSMVMQLNTEAEELFSNFKPKLRSQIRRPSKSGISAKVISCEKNFQKDLNGFYHVFSNHMRDLGTPVFPKKLFSNTCRAFGKNAKIISAWHLKECVAAGITIEKDGRVEIPWASSLRRFNKAAPNMLMYWEAIKSAANDGALSFDFGRSSLDSGPQRFKKQWGSEPVELHWYYLGKPEAIPDITPANPKFSFLVSCWKKLPIPVSKTIGPWISKSLP